MGNRSEVLKACHALNLKVKSGNDGQGAVITEPDIQGVTYKFWENRITAMMTNEHDLGQTATLGSIGVTFSRGEGAIIGALVYRLRPKIAFDTIAIPARWRQELANKSALSRLKDRLEARPNPPRCAMNQDGTTLTVRFSDDERGYLRAEITNSHSGIGINLTNVWMGGDDPVGRLLAIADLATGA
jgi:hypothetical protein